MRLMLSAGEASGDSYGAMLLDALRKHEAIGCFGSGGEKMRAAGCELIVNAGEVAAVGITEIVAHLPRIFAGYRKLVSALRKRRPDALVLIDFPDINFKLARHAHRLGIPVIFFVSPQIWAWKPWRIRLVQQYVDKMLVIFHFEEKFYRERQVNAEFVGHPLADLPLPAVSREDFARQHELDAAKPWIALLPGSRRGEVQLNLPELIRCAALLGKEYDYVLPVASTLTAEYLWGRLAEGGAHITLVPHAAARAALFHARASVVASGTATVEAALLGNPFVVVYRVSGLTYAVGKRLVCLDNYAMVNLIAGREIVPELIQARFSAENVVAQLHPLLEESAARTRMIADLSQVRQLLRHREGGKAMARAAAAVLAMVSSAPKDERTASLL